MAVSFNETDPAVGDPVKIAAVVANRDDESRTYLAQLVVDGELSATDRVRVGANTTAEVTFVREFTDSGSHEVAVGSTPVGTLVVAPPGATDRQTTTAPLASETTGEGGIRVVDARAVYSWVRAGHDARVQVVVANAGSRTATRALVVAVDGDPVATGNVTLDPGARRTLSLSFPATEGRVTVEGVAAGRLQVGNATVAPAAEIATAEDGPGFGAGAALLGLAVVSMRLLGRNEDEG